MNKKRFILRTVFWSAFTAAVYFPTSEVVTIQLYYHKDPAIQAYVEQNLEQIIEKQEKKIGITYPTERPKIEYLLPEEKIYPGILGLYNDREDTLYLPSGILTKPRWNFGDLMTVMFTANRTVEARRVLDHELAHFYCDKLKEHTLGKDYFLRGQMLFSEEELMADKLINEGIAEYVENTMNGEERKPFDFQKWPLVTEQFANDTIYRGGYALVKTIIDQYGEKGIQFLLFNLPTEKELFTPKKYQERVLNDIAKIKGIEEK